MARSADHDNDLVQETGAATQAIGQVTHVFGRVLDLNGLPIAVAGGDLAVRCHRRCLVRAPAA